MTLAQYVRCFLFGGDLPEARRLVIPPGLRLSKGAPARARAKRARAIAFLGDRWCLAGTRAAQVARSKNEAEFL